MKLLYWRSVDSRGAHRPCLTLLRREWWNEAKCMRWVCRNGGKKFVARENGRNPRENLPRPLSSTTKSPPSCLLYCCCCNSSGVLRRSLTSQVISVAVYIEREKSDEFCSEALISAWGSFTCRKSMTRDPRLSLPSEGSHTAQDFYALEKSIDPGRVLNCEPLIQWRVW